jgi:1-acyl-sn-glycerol-3-phosphate acyltransferase
MIIYLRSLVFYAAFYSWTLLLAFLFIPLLLLPRIKRRIIPRIWIRGTLFMLSAICGLSYRVVGVANIPAEYGYFIAAKHQSAWETLALNLIIEKPVFVIKRELLQIPVFGWYLKAIGAIAINRSSKIEAIKSIITQAKQSLLLGETPIIFPEGTRTEPGVARKYQRGVAALYKELGVPVVPIAHNAGMFWRRNSIIKRPGVITLSILPAIPPSLTQDSFMSQLHEAIETECARFIG